MVSCRHLACTRQLAFSFFLPYRLRDKEFKQKKHKSGRRLWFEEDRSREREKAKSDRQTRKKAKLQRMTTASAKLRLAQRPGALRLRSSNVGRCLPSGSSSNSRAVSRRHACKVNAKQTHQSAKTNDLESALSLEVCTAFQFALLLFHMIHIQ